MSVIFGDFNDLIQNKDFLHLNCKDELLYMETEIESHNERYSSVAKTILYDAGPNYFKSAKLMRLLITQNTKNNVNTVNLENSKSSRIVLPTSQANSLLISHSISIDNLPEKLKFI